MENQSKNLFLDRNEAGAASPKCSKMDGEVSSEIITDKKLTDLQEAFSLVDHQGDGFINQRKLFQAMTSLGKNPTEAEVQDLISAADKDGNGTIEMDEFVNLMSDRTLNVGNRTSELMEAFQAFDRDHDGCIDLDDLTSFVKRLGFDLSEYECDELVSQNSLHQKGLSFTDFVNIYKTEDG